MHDAFVSHASSDRTVAEAVRSKLQDAELGCWMAPHDIVAGTTWAEAIIEGVRGDHWLGVGAEGGDVMAATNLGLMLRDHRDRRQGIEWLRRGAAGGDGLAASELARMARGEA